MDQIDQNAAEIQGRAAADRLAAEAFTLLTAMRFGPELRARLTQGDREKYVRHVFVLVAGLVGGLVCVQDAQAMLDPNLDPGGRYAKVAVAIASVLGIDEREALDLINGQFGEASNLQGPVQ